MNQMSEMYKSFSERYEALISHEDYQNNLKVFLQKNINWKDKTIYEFGAGTGRITQFYENDIKKAEIFDNSDNMLEVAKKKITNQNITITKLDNTEIHTINNLVDIVIEGWSFGHLLAEKSDDVYTWLKYLDQNCKRLAKGNIVIIETMGTNVNIPEVKNKALKKMYEYLEQNAYKKSIIKTDYQFENYEEAATILGSFFGNDFEKDIRQSKKHIIPEYTGIWIYEKSDKAKEKSYLFNK